MRLCRHDGSGDESTAAPRSRCLAASLVFVLAFALFLPTLSNEFVWDDVQITVDPYIHDSANWADVLTYRTLARDIIDNNRPAMLLTLMADAAIWGKRAFGYHLTNNLLHAANAALLCLLACRALSLRGKERTFRRMVVSTAGSGSVSTTGASSAKPKGRSSVPLPSETQTGVPTRWALFIAAGAAMLFAVHPLVVEAVSVVCFREDAQVAFLVLASVWLAAQLDRQGSARTSWPSQPEGANARAVIGRIGVIAGAWLCVLLAVGTKESGIVAPLLLLAWAFLIRSRDASRGAKSNSPWIVIVAGAFVIAAGFLIARFALQPWPSEVYPNPPQRQYGSLGAWLPYQTRVFALYLGNIFVPTQLSAYYSPGLYGSIGLGRAMTLSGVALGVIMSLAWRNRLAFLGATLLGVGLAAVANLVPIYNPVADRYLYLPLAGGAWLLAGTLYRLGRTKLARGIVAALIGFAFLGLSVQNLTRQRVFRSERTLWTDAAQKAPDGFQPFNPLGWTAYATGEYEQALDYFGIALENAHNLDPDSWAGAALCLAELGRPADAERAYREAVAVQPRFRDPRLIQKTYFWRQEYLDRLAVVARRTGLWVENTNQLPNSPTL
jgi:tetratricopeptide (TPR) repeat protein